MIRIEKPDAPPARLTEKGKPKARGMKSAYTRNPAPYDSGDRTFNFDSGIYGHKSVRDALTESQHSKCCFCESKVRHVAHGDVEHFRPKGGYQQSTDAPLRRPGYYWLAYDWPNLLFSCQICNQKYKKNLFPLTEPADRAINHHHDEADEAPIFIHPVLEDPEEHLTFHEEIVIGRTQRGRATITLLGLGRPDLEVTRQEALKPYVAIKDLLIGDLSGPDRAKIKDLIHSVQQSSSQYSAMFRAFFKD